MKKQKKNTKQQKIYGKRPVQQNSHLNHITSVKIYRILKSFIFFL